MQDLDFPTPDVPVDSVSPDALKERIDAGMDVVILDTRMSAEYGEWRITGEFIKSINIPYFHFLDDNIDDAFLEQIPSDQPVTVLCAKGGASEFVAGRLAAIGYDVDHLEDGMNGWARIYESVEIGEYDGNGAVLQYQRPSSGCLGYLVYDDGKAAVIDPLRAFSQRYIDDADALGVELTYAFDTHIHADHISGLRALNDAGIEAVLPRPSADRGATYGESVTLADEGDTFRVGDVQIEAVATPGHTTDMTSYLIDEELLLTGDALFIESVARPDLEEGDDGAPAAAEMLYDSLHSRILSRSDTTLIGGAHYSDAAEPAPDGTYTASLAELTDAMDALSFEKDAFVSLILSDMPPRPRNYETIIATNLGQHEPSDDEAFELELGPNNCAASNESLAAD